MAVIHKERVNEILDYLKTKMEIPDNITEFSISFGMNSIPQITCTYYPKVKENEL